MIIWPRALNPASFAEVTAFSFSQVVRVLCCSCSESQRELMKTPSFCPQNVAWGSARLDWGFRYWGFRRFPSVQLLYQCEWNMRCLKMKAWVKWKRQIIDLLSWSQQLRSQQPRVRFNGFIVMRHRNVRVDCFVLCLLKLKPVVSTRASSAEEFSIYVPKSKVFITKIRK